MASISASGGGDPGGDGNDDTSAGEAAVVSTRVTDVASCGDDEWITVGATGGVTAGVVAEASSVLAGNIMCCSGRMRERFNPQRRLMFLGIRR